MTVLAWVKAHLRALLGLDWIDEAREIAAHSRERQNVIADQLSRQREREGRDAR